MIEVGQLRQVHIPNDPHHEKKLLISNRTEFCDLIGGFWWEIIFETGERMDAHTDWLNKHTQEMP